MIHMSVTQGYSVSTFWGVSVSQTLQICGSGLNKPENENKKKKRKT